MHLKIEKIWPRIPAFSLRSFLPRRLLTRQDWKQNSFAGAAVFQSPTFLLAPSCSGLERRGHPQRVPLPIVLCQSAQEFEIIPDYSYAPGGREKVTVLFSSERLPVTCRSCSKSPLEFSILAFVSGSVIFAGG